jgi:predicted ATPase
MFTRISLKNFKAWREHVDVDLAPVTVFLGTNSSGKSSILQTLLLLKQTAASPDRTVHLNLGGDEVNDYFNFGHFDDVLTRGATPREFELGFAFAPDNKKEPYEFSASYIKSSSGAPVVQTMLLFDCFFGTYSLERSDNGEYSLFAGNMYQSTTYIGSDKNYSPERSIELSDETVQVLRLLLHDEGQADDLSFYIRRKLESITYLGPLRRPPSRDYVWNKMRPGMMAMDGGNFSQVLIADQSMDDSESIAQSISKWLNRMGMAEELEVRQIGNSAHYELIIHKDGVPANLRDVGIGVSQVLPVLTTAYFAPPGSTVILEEPEIHLHPLAQAVLAELFVEVSKQRKVQFLVETHSEHLFRRLQTLVAKQTLSTDDCRLYFVERQGADAVLKNLELDEYGRVKDWPQHFFGDALGETREQARLMFERQQQQNQSQ